MLRSEHSIVRYDFQRRRVQPDRLRRGRDDDYLSAAKILLRLYRDGIGKIRQSMHRDVEETLARLPSCPPRRIAAFCKLLDDQSTFQSDKTAAVALRKKVFSIAAPMHPIVQQKEGVFDKTIDQARHAISDSVGLTWKEIDAKLFSDVIELQILKAFDRSIEPVEFLSIYNVAQTQAALYRATRVRIDAYDDFKTILRHAKLAGLMHGITKLEGSKSGYRFDLDGPQSSLRETTRYGIRFASMLPKLLTCRDWRLTAEVIGPQRQRFQLQLSPDDGLKSTLQPPGEFDSGLEQEVWSVWNHSPADGWSMEREMELLHRGQSVLTPDFVLRQRSSSRKIYLEVVGYWTPEYLAEKCRRLESFIGLDQETRWLLMFPKPKASVRQKIFADLAVRCIVFDKQSKPVNWIAAVSDEFE